MAKSVTVIPPSKERYTQAPIGTIRKRRACGYARVSTDSEEQHTSYESQLRYYEEYIKGRDDLEFVGMYSDEGITATSMKHRTGFNQMVSDALDGKIDLIITKSVSRFARNTVDSLTTVRQLKEKGVEIYFEKENIWTLDSKGELLITIMSSLAQEESRSISENTTWGQRKRMAEGHGCLSFKNFLGYDKGPNGEFVINPEQAKIVRRIYTDYLEGLNTSEIAKALTRDGIMTPGGLDKWYTSSVISILKNEKYKGDCLMQKTYTENFLTKKQIKNQGEMQQYYVEDHHPAIVSKELFDAVQVKMARHTYKKHLSAARDFSSMIVCGDCGYLYGSKVIHSNDPYRKVVYYCNKKYKGEKCNTPIIKEERLKELFVEAINLVLENKDEVIENLMMLNEICTRNDYDLEIRMAAAEFEKAEKEYQEVLDQQKLHPEAYSTYEAKVQEAMDAYNDARKKYSCLADKNKLSTVHEYERERIINILKSQENLITEYDCDLMKMTVDVIKVYNDGKIVFVFAGGVEIELTV